MSAVKQKRWPINLHTSKSFPCILLAIASIFYLNGCVTMHAMEWAEEKASPELNCEYLNIRSVLSAVKQENGDISICVQLEYSRYTEAEQSKVTITLPFSELTGAITAGADLDPDESRCPSSSSWYPIEKTLNGCEKISPGSLSSPAVLSIEKFDVREENRDDLYDLLVADNKDSQIIDKIYEISFVTYEEHSETGADSDDLMKDWLRSVNDVIVVYWPAQIGQQRVHPIRIIGIYEDQSSEYSYLIFPIAIAMDAGILVFFYFVKVLTGLK